MTKEITKSIILQEIQDKFKLRELTPEKFTFGEEVVPTYDVSQHLVTGIVKAKNISITSAAAFVFFAVPQDERWFLRSYQVIFKAVGAYTVSGAYVGYRPLITDYIYLDLTAAQSTSYLVILPSLVQLDKPNQLFINVDGYTSTADLEVDIDVLVEKIR